MEQGTRRQIGLVLVALVTRILAYFYFVATVGDSFFLANGKAKLFRYSMLQFSGIVPLQAYDDVTHHYVPYVDAFLHGWNPYLSYGLPTDSISGNYNYGPLWIILVSIPALFGISAYTSIFISNLVFDVANTLLLYQFAARLSTERKAVMVAIAYSLSPIVLFYVSYKLFNIPQMLLFTLLSLIALHDGHDDRASIFLALGFLIKLAPILLLIPFSLYWWAKQDRTLVFREWLVFACYSIFGLVPFIIASPLGLFNQMLKAGSQQTTNSTLGALVQSIVILNWPFYILLFFTFLLFIKYKQEIMEDKVTWMRFVAGFLMGAHGSFYGLWSRGFKYYIPYYYPFVILVLLVGFQGWKAEILGILGLYFYNVVVFATYPYLGLFSTRHVTAIFLPVILYVILFIYLRKRKKRRIAGTGNDDDSNHRIHAETPDQFKPA